MQRCSPNLLPVLSLSCAASLALMCGVSWCVAQALVSVLETGAAAELISLDLRGNELSEAAMEQLVGIGWRGALACLGRTGLGQSCAWCVWAGAYPSPCPAAVLSALWLTGSMP